MVDIMDTALDTIGAKAVGWRADIVKNSSALAASAHQKLVEVGENREPLEGSELQGRVLHEVGIHALRSVNAEHAGWLSATYGQDDYLSFEEALATALEDAFHGEFIDHGVQYYLIAGLAYGFDNHAPRDFREVYDIMYRFNALKKVATEGVVLNDEVLADAKSKAFTNVLRMFRGTTTHDRGVIYLKDLAYFQGQELAWSVLDNVHTQEDFDLLLAGKLDLTRSDHLAIAQDIQATLKP